MSQWMRRSVVGAGMVVLALSSIGCIGFRGGELEETRAWPPAAPSEGKKPSISISLVGKAVLRGNPVAVPPKTSDAWYKKTREAYESAGLFSQVKGPGEPSDLRVDVEVLDQGHGSTFLAVLCGLTLTVIPATATDEFTWRSTFKDGSGTVRGTIEKKDSVTMWIELLLLFGMPFGTPASAANGAMSDLNRSSILDALEKGYLKP